MSHNHTTIVGSMAIASELNAPASGKQLARLAEDLAAPVTPPLSIGDQRLLVLADFLTTLKPEQLDLHSYVRTSEMIDGCGTVCCAMGWCPRVFPDHWEWFLTKDLGYGSVRRIGEPEARYGPWASMCEFFGIDMDHAQAFFHAGHYHVHASSVMVADRIREFVSERNGGASC